MQAHHGLLGVAGNQVRQRIQASIDGAIDLLLLFPARRLEHEIGHIVLARRRGARRQQVARVPDAQAQAPELLRGQVRGDVLQAVMAARAAPELELDRARRQVQLVVRDQDLVGHHLVEARQRHGRQAGAVHEGLWLQQPHLVAPQVGARGIAVEARLVAQRHVAHARELVDQPKAGVVPRGCVFGARIAEPDDEFDHAIRFRVRCRKRPVIVQA